ncbi:MAG: flagellar basal body-associated protein FliL [Myxococcota bacterium]
MSKEDSPPKKSLLVPILIGTNILTLGGVVAALLLAGSSAPSTAEPLEGSDVPQEPATVGAGITAEVGSFTINLRDPGSPRYLKAAIKAEVSSETTKEEVRDRDAKIRDVTISYLSSLALTDTQGARAKEDIRENLRKRINNILTTGEAYDIFLTEFVTQ